MTNVTRTTLYVGVTNDIERRVLEHKSGYGSEFTTRYKLHDLLYFDDFERIEDAIVREKQIKNWHREWKMNLILEQNPLLKDLAFDWFDEEQIEECRSRLRDSETSSE